MTKKNLWTSKEEEQLWEGFNQGISVKNLAKKHNRTVPSVKMKIKRLKQKKGVYNEDHYVEKNNLNELFVEHIQPKSVLDLYSNKGTPAYNGLNVYRNDINKTFDVDSNEDALTCLCRLYSEGKKYDIIDLDPFGSAYDCFDLSIKMAKKGLCVTFGELGSKRFKRLDYVMYRYDFYSLEEFTLPNMIQYIQKIGLRNKKKLTIWDCKQWDQIGRVWFTITPVKGYGSKVTESKSVQQTLNGGN